MDTTTPVALPAAVVALICYAFVGGAGEIAGELPFKQIKRKTYYLDIGQILPRSQAAVLWRRLWLLLRVFVEIHSTGYGQGYRVWKSAGTYGNI